MCMHCASFYKNRTLFCCLIIHNSNSGKRDFKLIPMNESIFGGQHSTMFTFSVTQPHDIQTHIITHSTKLKNGSQNGWNWIIGGYACVCVCLHCSFFIPQLFPSSQATQFDRKGGVECNTFLIRWLHAHRLTKLSLRCTYRRIRNDFIKAILPLPTAQSIFGTTKKCEYHELNIGTL